MTAPITHIESGTWLDATETVTADELARACGLSADQLDELVEYGALLPLPTPLPGPTPALERVHLFSATCVIPLRTACHVQRDFDLDLFTAGVLVGYLTRIDTLERQILSLHAQGSSAHKFQTDSF